jgi:hypothetical protein
MIRNAKYLTLGVGFLASMLVFSMAAAAGAIIINIALPALARSDHSGGEGGLSSGGSPAGSSTTITNVQMQLAQAITALQNKNTTGAMMHLKLINQTLTTLSTAGGGMATFGGGGGGSSGTSGNGPSGGGSVVGGSSGTSGGSSGSISGGSSGPSGNGPSGGGSVVGGSSGTSGGSISGGNGPSAGSSSAGGR